MDRSYVKPAHIHERTIGSDREAEDCSISTGYTADLKLSKIENRKEIPTM